MDMLTIIPIKFKLAHMTTQKLIKILSMRNCGVDSDLIKKKFFSELSYIQS
ncbi:MAG: hypothetical protein AB6733_08230 [Clostridiaceae bacterium]